MNDRPVTTLFMLTSLDGKISTGDVDERDVDKDFPRIGGIKEGLQQYYELETHTDRVSLNSGKVQAKVGVNRRTWDGEPGDVDFVVVDSKPHLSTQGAEYFARRSGHFYLITSNPEHPAFALQRQYTSIHILCYEHTIDFADAFRRLRQEFGVETMTIQTGGALDAIFLRSGLVDKVSIVIAPCLIGGDTTQGLIGGEALRTEQDLLKIRPLKLNSVKSLENSYLHVTYNVINDVRIAA